VRNLLRFAPPRASISCCRSPAFAGWDNIPCVRHRLFTVASALSLLAFAATVVLLIRSFTTRDLLGVARVESSARVVRVAIVSSNRGLMSVTLARDTYLTRPEFDKRVARIPRSRVEYRAMVPRPWRVGTGLWNWLGFGHIAIANSTESELLFSFPHWLLLLPCIPLPAWWLWSRRSLARRRLAGCCPHCGYDLRATPDRCPECGSIRRKGSTNRSTPAATLTPL